MEIILIAKIMAEMLLLDMEEVIELEVNILHISNRNTGEIWIL